MVRIRQLFLARMILFDDFHEERRAKQQLKLLFPTLPPGQNSPAATHPKRFLLRTDNTPAIRVMAKASQPSKGNVTTVFGSPPLAGILNIFLGVSKTFEA